MKPRPEPQESEDERKLIPFLLFLSFMLTVLGLLLYAQSLLCPFLWDEYGIILDNAQKGAFEWRHLPGLFGHRYFHIPGTPDLQIRMPYYRPVSILFHALSYHAFGPIPSLYRLESLLLHVGNTVLLFVLFSAFISDGSPRTNERAAALFGALLFFVHPRNVESVCIIANQTGLLCTSFSLLSLLCWTRILVGSSNLFSLYAASLLTLLLAMLAKESGYVVPLLHGLLLLVFGGRRNGRMLCLLPGYFLVVGVPLSVRHFCLGGTSIGDAFLRELSRQGSLFLYLESVLALLAHQLDQWFFPVRIQLFQYPYLPEGLTLREAGVAAGACGFIVWRLRRNLRVLAFGFALFLIAYLPSSNLIPMGKLPGGGLKTGAHHLYFAQAGLALLVSLFFFPPDRRAVAPAGRAWTRLICWPLAGILTLLLCLQTFVFSGYFSNADRFYRAVLERNPVYSGAWQNYGWHKLYLENEPEEAERILLEGIEVMVSEADDRGETKLVWNLLHLYLENGRVEEAATLFQCVTEEWLEDLVGNHYFWSLVRRLRKEEKT